MRYQHAHTYTFVHPIKKSKIDDDGMLEEVCLFGRWWNEWIWNIRHTRAPTRHAVSCSWRLRSAWRIGKRGKRTLPGNPNHVGRQAIIIHNGKTLFIYCISEARWIDHFFLFWVLWRQWLLYYEIVKFLLKKESLLLLLFCASYTITASIYIYCQEHTQQEKTDRIAGKCGVRIIRAYTPTCNIPGMRVSLV